MTDVPPPPPPPPPYTPPPSGGADIGAALSYGFRKFQTNIGPLLAIILLPVAVQLVLGLVGQFGFDSLVGLVFLNVLSTLISLVAAIGIFNAGLLITAGETPTLARAFSSERWGEWILFALVFGLMVGVGAALCGVGALFVIAFFGLAPFYFLDRGMGLGDALSASLETTRSVSGLPIALAVVALVGVAGVIACGVGLLITMPAAYVGAAFLYRGATNQPVAP